MYHIMLRGNSHCHLFEDEADYKKFLSILRKAKANTGFQLFAYCLMSNHVHLIIQEQSTGDITEIMRTLLTTYAGWFNRKYQRIGSLISNRYKSKCLTGDQNLLTVLRYIHQNPVKAGIVAKAADYVWSSYNEYIRNAGENADRGFIYSMLSPVKMKAITQFKELHDMVVEGTESDFVPSDAKRKDENEVRHIIMEMLGGKEPSEIIGYFRKDRDIILRKLRAKGLSIRQIERATGISRGIIAKC